MIIKDKKEFSKGLILAISFFVVLVIMFMPVFGEGRNAFRASDRFFNSIAKGSTYYIPGLFKENEHFIGAPVDATLLFENPEMAKRARELLFAAGASVGGENGDLAVKGDLGRILEAALQDADAMFFNKGDVIRSKYGFEPREALYAWHVALKNLSKALTKQEKFDQAAHIQEVMERGVEVGYNFYNIEPIKVTDRLGTLIFSLVFYVAYTMWWGFAILFLFEGFGLEMKKTAKKEV